VEPGHVVEALLRQLGLLRQVGQHRRPLLQ
jgi:hypothetical protein